MLRFGEKHISDVDPSYRLERVHCDDLTVAEFRQQYVFGKNPLIIEGMAKYFGNGQPLGIEYLERILDPDIEVEPKGVGRVRLGCFLEMLRACRTNDDRTQATPSANEANGFLPENDEYKKNAYLNDCSVASHFPQLFTDFVKVPKYVLHCFWHRTRDQSLQRMNYVLPSLFWGSKGSYSELHIDQYSSNFWMFLFEGAKAWSVFHPDDMDGIPLQPFVERYFDEDLQNWRWSSNAGQQGMFLDNSHTIGADVSIKAPRRIDFVLRSGEMLFMPAHSPHEVYNLVESVGLSGNFWDHSNLEQCLVQFRAKIAWLREQAAKDQEALCSKEGDVIKREKVMGNCPGRSPTQMLESADRFQTLLTLLDEIEFPAIENDLDYAEREILAPEREERELEAMLCGVEMSSQAMTTESDFVGLYPLHKKLSTQSGVAIQFGGGSSRKS